MFTALKIAKFIEIPVFRIRFSMTLQIFVCVCRGLCMCAHVYEVCFFVYPCVKARGHCCVFLYFFTFKMTFPDLIDDSFMHV